MPGNYKVSASAPGYLTESGTFGDDVKVLSPHDEPYCIDCYTTFNFRLVMEPTNGVEPEISTKSFEFAGWGAYRFADISGKRYFAAYLEEPTPKMLDAGESIPYLWQKSNGKDLQKNGQLSEVLMDDNEERTLTSSEPLKLEEGYELAITSIYTDGNKVYLELSKDGQVVDAKLIKPFPEFKSIKDRTYYYKSDVGRTKKVVQIAVYFKNAFRGGSGIDLATVGGVFQISDSPLDISGGD
jgi:S-layer protein (TIGR01567 family)